MSRNLAPPPSDVTGSLGRWLRDAWTWIEAQPQWSIASFGAAETPNSRVTAATGGLCINIGSASTQSRLWVMGATSDRTDQGWVLARIVQP